ncbi:M18 family aminopeptidase [Gilvimarinus xylanilyticus]|uniref:M18 family aminopeptidase n=1 Tax=Gilvimarinus xylanilyticus TaxID=2944139 RepID=A0A9X2HVX4_9GAMM|nr:M18 family aminopeptidase [Gilvimarinus xylanilyticus]MCP8898654.1 M18 family aminopeptidase [Gilvimarinus xylanilyticus]
MTEPSNATFNSGLIDFIATSPTPFHATREMARQLSDAGFREIDEADHWQLEPGGRYFVIRNGSSLIAFIHGRAPLAESGIRMLGAHTDSPCLKVKPNAKVTSAGYYQLGVETYGGVLLSTWFDRDLSLAGRVTFRSASGSPASRLIDFRAPIAVVPSLAIHLDREANRNRSINPQTDIRPILMLADENPDEFTFSALLMAQLQAEHPGLEVREILDFELSLYDTQKPAQMGLKGEFVASARLDNLLSCYVGLDAIKRADDAQSCLLVCTDHEEIGSASACGAKGPMLEQFLQRLQPDVSARLRTLDASMMISADNAHAVHPNFVQKHDAEHGPVLNAGPVIKINANQRYATTSETSGLFKMLCAQVGVSVQSFVSRTDMECGSTIGPITSAEVGVKTIDVGVPTFAMHSTRELAGSDDAFALARVIQAYFARPQAPGRFETQ